MLSHFEKSLTTAEPNSIRHLKTSRSWLCRTVNSFLGFTGVIANLYSNSLCQLAVYNEHLMLALLWLKRTFASFPCK